MQFTKKEVILLLTLFLIIFAPATDPDFFWHLKYGEGILSSRVVPSTDTYSYTMAGYKWADSYWMPQVIFALLVNNIGYFSVPLLFSLLISTFFIFLTKDWGSYYTKFITLLFLFLVLSLFATSVRPLMFSTVLMFALVGILSSNRLQKYIFFAPLLFLFWVNSHADFMLGLFVFGVYVFVLFVEVLNARSTLKDFYRYTSIFIASAAMTLVQPSGTSLHKTLLKELESSSLHRASISEFTTVSFTGAKTHYITTVFFIAVLVFYMLNEKELLLESREKKFLTLIIISFILLSIRSTYFLRVLSVVSAPFLYAFFKKGESFYLRIGIIMKSSRYLSLYSRITFSMLLFSIFIKNFEGSINLISISYRGKYPYDAVNFIKENRLPGNMFNSYGWGGYLIFTLPEHKTFIDGRMASWKIGDFSILREYLEIEMADEGEFNAYSEKYDFSFVLFPKQSRFIKKLKENPLWETLYEDDIAVVAKKRDNSLVYVYN